MIKLKKFKNFSEVIKGCKKNNNCKRCGYFKNCTSKKNRLVCTFFACKKLFIAERLNF